MKGVYLLFLKVSQTRAVYTVFWFRPCLFLNAKTRGRYDEDGFGFERYTEYVLDVPMYFVYRDGVYHDVTGRSFRDFMEARGVFFRRPVVRRPRVTRAFARFCPRNPSFIRSLVHVSFVYSRSDS